ncbi:MAG: GTPase HflX, partial [Pseudomonadota bacterium]
AQKKQVIEVLADLDVVDRETGASDIPILEVWNKADLLDEDRLSELSEVAEGHDAILISAQDGQGLDAFAACIATILTAKAREVTVTLPLSDGRRIAWLHAHGDIVEEADAGEGKEGPERRFTVRLNPKELGQYSTL